ncbi:mitochondrial import inner membrane translocase subunit TIM50 [Enteropsectra breve]|nr:mitochondrial import inner membrane translocase subunit TIM50 [Enteropsectra breve]
MLSWLANIYSKAKSKVDINATKNKIQSISSILYAKEAYIPQQKHRKPTVIFDMKNILYNNKFSLQHFDNVYRQRQFCQEFLFNLCYNYELIMVTDVYEPLGRRILQKLDPYGCISYPLFIPNKEMLRKEMLNRDLRKTIFISAEDSEFSQDFAVNTLHLPKWNGCEDKTLLSTLHFLNNINFSDITDYRPTIASYYRTDFSTVFDSIQRKLFHERNLFSFKNFDHEVAKVNQQKVSDFKNAKATMDSSSTRKTGAQYQKYVQLAKAIFLG